MSSPQDTGDADDVLRRRAVLSAEEADGSMPRPSASQRRTSLAKDEREAKRASTRSSSAFFGLPNKVIGKINAEDEEDDDDDELQKRPSLARLIGMTCLTMPLSLIWATMGFIVMPAEAHKFDPENESLFLALLFLLVGLSQLICPVAGKLSDTHRSRWGRRRPFIVGGTITAIISICGMWFSSSRGIIWLYPVCLTFAMGSSNVIHAAQASIVPDFFSRDRGMASGVVGILQFIGNFVGMLLFAVANLQVLDAYIMYIGLIIIVSTIVCLSTDEPSSADNDEVPITKEALVKCFYVKLDDSEADFFWVLIGRAFYYTSTAVQTFIYYYIRDMLEVPDEKDVQKYISMLVLVSMGCGLLVTFPMGKLSDRFGRKPFIYTACLTMAAVYMGYMLAPFAGKEKGLVCVYIGGALFGFGSGCYMAVDYALALDCLPTGENARGSSEALGLWGIASFAGSSGGPLIGGVLLEMGGQGAQKDMGHYVHRGYAAVLSLGMLSCVASAFVTSYIKKAD